MFDESMSTFFRNIDARHGHDIPVDGGRNAIKMLRARSVLIDTEEGVVRQVLNGPLGELFDQRQFITDVSGAGNNWYGLRHARGMTTGTLLTCCHALLSCRAHGHEVYGPEYEDAILGQVHKAVECCDSPQSFFTMHSLGGGTGALGVWRSA